MRANGGKAFRQVELEAAGRLLYIVREKREGGLDDEVERDVLGLGLRLRARVVFQSPHDRVYVARRGRYAGEQAGRLYASLLPFHPADEVALPALERPVQYGRGGGPGFGKDVGVDRDRMVRVVDLVGDARDQLP
jgi:hypothetical protein